MVSSFIPHGDKTKDAARSANRTNHCPAEALHPLSFDPAPKGLFRYFALLNRKKAQNHSAANAFSRIELMFRSLEGEDGSFQIIALASNGQFPRQPLSVTAWRSIMTAEI